jgi:hypothetical protein
MMCVVRDDAAWVEVHDLAQFIVYHVTDKVQRNDNIFCNKRLQAVTFFSV